MSNIKICFEFQLVNNEIQFYSDLTDEHKFGTPDFLKHVYKLLDKWYEGIDKDLLYYKDYFLPEIFKRDMFGKTGEYIKFLLFLISKENYKKNIEIYISNDYTIEVFLLIILAKLKVNYEIIKINKKAMLFKPTTNYYSFKNKIKNITLAIIDFVKKNKDNGNKIYFQMYHNSKNIIKYLDIDFVVDMKFEGMFSKDRPRYFSLPSNCNKHNNNFKNILYDISNNSNSDIEPLIIYIFKLFYFYSAEEIKCLIESITKKLKKFNIKHAILMSELPSVNVIISKYIRKNGGKVFLYNHGFRSYDYLDSKDVIKNVDGVFCWSEFEKKLYEKYMNNDIKLVVTGYPTYNELLGKKNIKVFNDISELTITIMTTIFQLEIVGGINKEIKDIISIVKLLLKLGLRKENIIIKLHPGLPDTKFYENIFNYYLNFKPTIKKENIIDIIENSDIVIGSTSTSIYESIFLNTPYIYFNNYSNFYKEHIILDLNIPSFKNMKELEEILINFNYPDFDLLQKKMLYKNDYKSVVKIIKETFNSYH